MSVTREPVHRVGAEEGRGRPAKKSPLWAKLSLLTGSVLVVFGGSELALRSIGAKPQTATVLKSFFQQSPASGWCGAPAVSCRLATASFEALVNHDANGLRCCGLPSRIEDDAHFQGTVTWCVGDSLTWGLGVADPATFVTLLNQHAGPTERFRNLGVSAFSSVQEYLLLKEQFDLGRHPDNVILLFCINDLEDNLNDNGGCPPRPYAELVGEKLAIRNYPVRPSASWNVVAWLKTQSLVYNYLHYYGTRAVGAGRNWFEARSKTNAPPASNREPEERQCVAEALPTVPQVQQRVLEEVYAMTKALCDEHQVRFTVAVEVDGAVGDCVRQVCRRQSIPVLDITKRLHAYQATGGDLANLHLQSDPHYNEAGHRLIAEAIQEEMRFLPAARKFTTATRLFSTGSTR